MKYLLILIPIVSLIIFLSTSNYKRIVFTTTTTTTTTTTPSIATTPPSLILQIRNDFPFELERLRLSTGAELGVQNGLFSEHLLTHWPSCDKFYLIDIWKPQTNYFDGANVVQHLQDRAYDNTIKRLDRFKNKTVILRMLTTDAVKHIPDGSLDFVYIDARHDYCGVMEDLDNYYPKVKSNGGILAGHDYKTAAEVRLADSSQNWAVCANGTRHEGAVKGAVDDFRQKMNITSKLYITSEFWASWLFFK